MRSIVVKLGIGLTASNRGSAVPECATLPLDSVDACLAPQGASSRANSKASHRLQFCFVADFTLRARGSLAYRRVAQRRTVESRVLCALLLQSGMLFE